MKFLSITAFILSIISILLVAFGYKFNLTDSGFLSGGIAIIGILATIMVGYQIYSAISQDGKINILSEKSKQLDEKIEISNKNIDKTKEYLDFLTKEKCELEEYLQCSSIISGWASVLNSKIIAAIDMNKMYNKKDSSNAASLVIDFFTVVKEILDVTPHQHKRVGYEMLYIEVFGSITQNLCLLCITEDKNDIETDLAKMNFNIEDYAPDKLKREYPAFYYIEKFYTEYYSYLLAYLYKK